ncbi:hypothetical protein SAY86_003635 [Trapa natans]|uniref:Uncharacterized protein n=1 Tax=Trapa natans TaxID=22666 RepID=A0AAN7M6H2_TRANT|nr:hypothetical protein SAY86_003635 [Trapa natans]
MDLRERRTENWLVWRIKVGDFKRRRISQTDCEEMTENETATLGFPGNQTDVTAAAAVATSLVPTLRRDVNGICEGFFDE